MYVLVTFAGPSSWDRELSRVGSTEQSSSSTPAACYSWASYETNKYQIQGLSVRMTTFPAFFLFQVDDISKIISHRQIVELAF